MALNNRAILFYNPKAGHIRSDSVKQTICDYFAKTNIDLKIVEVPRPHEELTEIVTDAIADGIDHFIAAGGDGTISFVGTHFVGKDQALGIIPLGTGNLISKELNIPQNLEKALELIIVQNHTTIQLDTIEANGLYYIGNISAGVSPKIMDKIKSDQKQRFGIFAYLFYLIQQLLGLKLERFYLDYDHQKSTYLASEVLISNCKTVGVEPLKWSRGVDFDDGILNIFVIRAANIRDLLSLILSIFRKKERLNPKVKMAHFKDYCRIETQDILRVQADGDCVGHTPIEIHVNPKSLRIIVGS